LVVADDLTLAAMMVEGLVCAARLAEASNLHAAKVVKVA
jgi:hypothetical protein